MADVVGEVRECANPECDALVEPDLDGDCSWYECEECGYAFGYTLLPRSDDTCSYGVPLDVQDSSEPGTSPVIAVTIGKREGL